MIPQQLMDQLEADRRQLFDGEITEEEHGVRVKVIMLGHPQYVAAIVDWATAEAAAARRESEAIHCHVQTLYPDTP